MEKGPKLILILRTSEIILRIRDENYKVFFYPNCHVSRLTHLFLLKVQGISNFQEKNAPHVRAAIEYAGTSSLLLKIKHNCNCKIYLEIFDFPAISFLKIIRRFLVCFD